MTTEIDVTGDASKIAIVGMACRMPGAVNVEEFWNNLLGGVESISSFTDEELLSSGIAPTLVRSPHYVKSRGIIGGADKFDASFFGFTPREAELLDPQHRVFLECCWHALEDAGYDTEKTAARVGVYGGIGTNWHLGNVDAHPDVMKFSSGASVVTSNDKDYLTTRVSYKLNLTGPSVNVQCACSTSLVATIMGMNSLLSYQCDMILAGGATIEIPEKKGYLYQEGGMESPDGRCRPFDKDAKGTVFSRGAGVIVLKRLEDAVRDGDHIYAVIRGGAVNNDGSMKVGYTAPSVQGQVEVAVEALAMAGVSAESIAFVEAHGTATPLGDPIEVSSLTQTFKNYTGRRQFCALGSVKGNIGHTDVASGAAGIIKAALALKHRRLPASLNYKSPNPKIDFESSPFFVNTETRELMPNGTPLRALINSFGVGGTNACIILEEPPATTRDNEEATTQNLLVLSAKTDTALDAKTAAIKEHLEKHATLNLDDVAYTSQVGRKHFKHRRFVVFKDRDNLIERLNSPSKESLIDAVCEKEGSPIVFAFPGQGNQYTGMGRDLYRDEKVFRETVDACCEMLRPALGLDLRDIIFADGDASAEAAAKLNQTYITQPALFVISYATARLWMSLGIEPAALVGHSVGEYVAACVAGVFSLEDALNAVARRGKLIQDLPGGSMLAALVSEDKLAPYLSPALEVAAVNSPQLTVVAGATEEIAGLEERLSAAKIFHKRLDTSHAFHSAMMDAALPAYAKFFENVTLREPSIPIASTLTGKWLTADEATDPNYWVSHVRRAVRFSDAVRTVLADDAPRIFLESGPGHSLESAIKYHLTNPSPHAVVGTMRAANDEGTDAEFLLRAVGRLWASGREVEWTKLHGERKRRRLSLPGYPFERKKFALDFSKNKVATKTSIVDDSKKPDVGDWFYLPTWKRTPSPQVLRRAQRNSATDERSFCWLLFKDDVGLADEIGRQLERSGDEVIYVEAGNAFGQSSESLFVIRPRVKDDYERLIGELKSAGKKPSRVLHLWNVEAEDHQTTLAELDAAEARSFYSPFFIEQAFIKHNVLDDLRLIVAATGALDIAGEGVRSPVKALSMGTCRVLGKEFPMTKSRFVDLTTPRDERALKSLAENLIEETRLDTDDTVAAYRNGYRWTESFDTVYFDKSDGLQSIVKDGGVYLITGGVGGLGLLIARRLAEMAKANFVLTHRSPMPEREEWQQWLAKHAQDDPTSEKIRGVVELEEAGATVMLAHADATDLAAMKKVKSDAQRKFGKIDGVIHSAGTPGGGIISLKTEQMVAEVIDPKVRGTLVLDELFRDESLDFLLLFSSITSVLGEAGRVDYCAANCFMDAYAQRHSNSHRVRSLDWGAWGEVGMAARWEESKAKRALAKPQPRTDGSYLQLVRKGDGQEIYDVLLDAEKDWVINDHLIFGIPTLVGATFLELIRQLAESKSPGCAPVLENMYFVSPLMFEPGKEKRLRLFVRESAGKFRFTFKSQSVEKDERKDLWHDHFTGDLLTSSSQESRRLDIAALSARLAGTVDHGPFFFALKGNGTPLVVEFGERWQTLKELSIGEREWLAKLELDESLAGDLHEFAFHPALTDVAIAAAVKHVTQAVYLPYAYKRIELKSPYTRNLWSHIRLNGDFQPGGETVAFDVTIMDEEGKELVTVERYNLKKVNLDAIDQKPAQHQSNGNGHKPSAEQARKSRSRPKDILPEEGLDALSRILGAPYVPQVIIGTSDLGALIEEAKPTTKKATKDEPAEDDAQKSPAYSRPSLSTPYEEPANEVEKAVVEIWRGILGIDQIGVNDDFTALGGNSLLAVQTVANIADAFQVDLPIESFFKRTTARGVAETVLELLVSMAGEETLDDLISELE